MELNMIFQNLVVPKDVIVMFRCELLCVDEVAVARIEES